MSQHRPPPILATMPVLVGDVLSFIAGVDGFFGSGATHLSEGVRQEGLKAMAKSVMSQMGQISTISMGDGAAINQAIARSPRREFLVTPDHYKNKQIN